MNNVTGLIFRAPTHTPVTFLRLQRRFNMSFPSQTLNYKPGQNPAVKMEDRPDIKFRRILEDIRSHFDFLFTQGFRVVSALYVGQGIENWQISLSEDTHLIKIYCDQGQLDMALSNLQLQDETEVFYLGEMVNFSNNGQELLKTDPRNETQQFEKLAYLMKTHMDNIFMLLDQ